MMDSWIEEGTERDYSQTEYGKNTLVVGESDGGDGEHPDSSGDDSREKVKVAIEQGNDSGGWSKQPDKTKYEFVSKMLYLSANMNARVQENTESAQRKRTYQ
jgi:hypothetical protein